MLSTPSMSLMNSLPWTLPQKWPSCFFPFSALLRNRLSVAKLLAQSISRGVRAASLSLHFLSKLPASQSSLLRQPHSALCTRQVFLERGTQPIEATRSNNKEALDSSTQLARPRGHRSQSDGLQRVAAHLRWPMTRPQDGSSGWKWRTSSPTEANRSVVKPGCTVPACLGACGHIKHVCPLGI